MKWTFFKVFEEVNSRKIEYLTAGAYGKQNPYALYILKFNQEVFTMTIYQQELLRKLYPLGFSGQFTEINGRLSFSCDGIEIGYQDADGYLYSDADKLCAEEMRKACDAVSEQARQIREYVGIY